MDIGSSRLSILIVLYCIIIFSLVVTFVVSIIKKNKHLIISILSTIIIFIVIPVGGIIYLFGESFPTVKGIKNFEDSMVHKYDFVSSVGSFNYRTMYYSIVLNTKRKLNWSEMKGLYIDTREFLLSEEVNNDLKRFYQKQTKVLGNFSKVAIEFDFLGDGKFDVKIEGSNQEVESKKNNWDYWDYGENSFGVSPNGVLIMYPKVTKIYLSDMVAMV